MWARRLSKREKIFLQIGHWWMVRLGFDWQSTSCRTTDLRVKEINLWQCSHFVLEGGSTKETFFEDFEFGMEDKTLAVLFDRETGSCGRAGLISFSSIEGSPNWTTGSNMSMLSSCDLSIGIEFNSSQGASSLSSTEVSSPGIPFNWIFLLSCCDLSIGIKFNSSRGASRPLSSDDCGPEIPFNWRTFAARMNLSRSSGWTLSLPT